MINVAVLVGRLTKDPVARKSQSGSTVTGFTIAIDRVVPAGKEKQTDFINCVVFGKIADFVEQYVRKGFLVGVTGRIQTRTYDDNSGKKVYVTEVIAAHVQNYEPRVKQGVQAPQQSYQDDYESDPSAPLDISSDELPFN